MDHISKTKTMIKVLEKNKGKNFLFIILLWGKIFIRKDVKSRGHKDQIDHVKMKNSDMMKEVISKERNSQQKIYDTHENLKCLHFSTISNTATVTTF